MTPAKRVHNLTVARALLSDDVRTSLRAVSALVEGEPGNLTGRIATIIVDSVEPLMLRIDAAIRDAERFRDAER